ncbi:MAG: threonine synthase [Candidatus Altarchaeaceae archaeon]
MFQKCIKCGKEYQEEIRYTCDCNGLLEILYDYENLKFDINLARKREFNLWRYEELLPVKKIVSLNEGGTPLYECKNLGKILNINLFVKNEGANPTGSFKDRGMTVGVSKAIEFKQNAVACASTGNTSASLAAYASRASIIAFVIIPKEKIAYGKLSQALIYGAKIIAIDGNFDEAFNKVIEISKKYKIYLLNSINPYRLEGQKTIAYEIFDQLDFVPDVVILPVGNAGNISAIWKGFKELKKIGLIDKFPRMIGIQAEGAKPIVNLFEGKDKIFTPIKNPETIATAIRIGNPISYEKAIRAIYESNGYAASVTDDEILNAQKILARKEGIFVEPASAASIAGLIKLKNKGIIKDEENVVAIATGNGLKDPDIVVKNLKDEIIHIRTEDVSKIIEKFL